MDKQKTNRLSEFEWYEIETKVRQTVYELMQPFQKRQIEEFSKLHQMRKEISEHGDKIKQYSFLLGSQGDEPPVYFKQMENQMGEIRNEISRLDSANKQTIGNFQIKLTFFEEKSEKFSGLINSFEQMRRERIQDKEQVTQLLSKQIQSLTLNVSNHEMETAATISSIKSRQFLVDQQILEMQNKLRQYDTTIRNSSSSLESLKRQFKSMTDRQFQENKYAQGIDARLTLLQTDKQLSKKFMGVVDEINNGVLFITTYIDKYLPLFVQAQLSDTLNSFITDKQRRALCVYEERAFQNFNKIIIQNANDGLTQNIRRYVGVVEQIIVRNRKYVIRLKVERKAKLGGKQYDIHILDDLDDQKRITTDSHPTDLKVKNLLTQQWTQFSTSLQQNFLKNAQNIRSQIEESLGLWDMKLVKFNEKIQKLEQLIKKKQIDSELDKKYIEKRLTETDLIGEQNKKQISIQKDISKQLINFCSIINHVVIQDELDKQSIALFGVRETTKGLLEKNDSPVMLDNKCLGCSGYPATTLSAFKMACLAYNPSSITVDGSIYKRQEILDLSTRLLQNIKNLFDEKITEDVSKNLKKTINQRQKQIYFQKTTTMNGFQTLELESKQVLPSIKSKRSNNTSVRRRSFQNSFIPISQDF